MKSETNPRCALAIVGMLAIAGLPCPSLTAAQTNKPDVQASGKPAGAARDRAIFDFAPMWRPVPRFPRDPDSTVPSAAYAMIWQPEWQVDIGLSDDQKNSLRAINAKAVADAQRHAEQFKRLSPAEQQVRIQESRERRVRLRDNGVGKQIEAVLTPRQLQTLKDFAFPEQVVGLLYDVEVRRDVGFSVEQEDSLRSLAKERLARLQEESLKRAERVWELLSPQQQTELPAIVNRQGPTRRQRSSDRQKVDLQRLTGDAGSIPPNFRLPHRGAR